MGTTFSGPKLPKEVSDCRASIAVQKALYVAGTPVVGYAQLQTGPSGLTVTRVFAELYVEVKTSARYTTGSGKNRRTHTARETQVVHRNLVQIGQFSQEGGGRTAGNQSFQLPFTIPSMPRAPSSASFGNPNSRSHGTITHFVALKVESNSQIYEVHRVPVQVLANPVVAQQPVDVATERPVTVCCCCDKGTFELAGRLPKTSFGPGERFQVIARVKNKSTIDPAHFQQNRCSVQIHETVHWTARGHGASATQKFSWPIAISLTGEDTQFEFDMPQSLYSSLNPALIDCPNVRIDHTVRINVQMPSCTSNASVDMAMLVHQEMPANMLPVAECVAVPYQPNSQTLAASRRHSVDIPVAAKDAPATGGSAPAAQYAQLQSLLSVGALSQSEFDAAVQKIKTPQLDSLLQAGALTQEEYQLARSAQFKSAATPSAPPLAVTAEAKSSEVLPVAVVEVAT